MQTALADDGIEVSEEDLVAAPLVIELSPSVKAELSRN
jgi:hypothetical protein